VGLAITFVTTKEHDISRSQLFAEALAAYSELRNSESITALLNEVYATESSTFDANLNKVQFDSINHETW